MGVVIALVLVALAALTVVKFARKDKSPLAKPSNEIGDLLNEYYQKSPNKKDASHLIERYAGWKFTENDLENLKRKLGHG